MALHLSRRMLRARSSAAGMPPLCGVPTRCIGSHTIPMLVRVSGQSTASSRPKYARRRTTTSWHSTAPTTFRAARLSLLTHTRGSHRGACWLSRTSLPPGLIRTHRPTPSVPRSFQLRRGRRAGRPIYSIVCSVLSPGHPRTHLFLSMFMYRSLSRRDSRASRSRCTISRTPCSRALLRFSPELARQKSAHGGQAAEHSGSACTLLDARSHAGAKAATAGSCGASWSPHGSPSPASSGGTRRPRQCFAPHEPESPCSCRPCRQYSRRSPSRPPAPTRSCVHAGTRQRACRRPRGAP